MLAIITNADKSRLQIHSKRKTNDLPSNNQPNADPLVIKATNYLLLKEKRNEAGTCGPPLSSLASGSQGNENMVCLARRPFLEPGSCLRSLLLMENSARLFLSPWLGDLLLRLPFAFLSDWISQCYQIKRLSLVRILLIPTPAGGCEVFGGG